MKTSPSLALSLALAAVVAGLVMPAHVSLSLAQGQTGTTEEVRKLDFLIGEWKGQGWKFGPDGKQITSFTQKTRVQLKEKDRTLRVKDSRTYKPFISTGEFFLRGTPVFHSSALDASIYYDEDVKLYRWRGESSYSRKNPLELSLVRDRTLQYGMPFTVELEPVDGNRRTTIEVTETGNWKETLEIWYSGRWVKAEESILGRIK